MIIVLLLILLFPVTGFGATIFSSNFDTCTGAQCYCSTTDPNGWDQWYRESCSATVGGVTHYSGEWSSPGRGGAGKSFKLWRNGSVFSGYDGGMLKVLGSSAKNIFMRFYVKIPVAMDYATGTEYQKWWRFNTSTDEVYVGTIDGFRSGRMEVYDNAEHTTILNNSQLLTLMDGNWHCLEIQFGLDNTTLKAWIDGTLQYNNTSKNWHGNTGATFSSYMQHFGFGNRGSTVTYQASWQAIEFDDLVIADAYVGPAGSGEDTTPPVISTPLPTGAQTCSVNPTAITLQVTTNESATCKYGISPTYSSSTSYDSLPFTFSSDASAQQTTHTQSVSSACGQSVTYYVRCMDAAENKSTASTAISYTMAPYVPPPARTVFLTEGFDDSSFSSRGWYDGTLAVGTTTKYAGSGAAQFAWANGATQPTGTNDIRYAITATDKLYVRFYWRFNSNWVGSHQAYHPHIFYVLSNLDYNAGAYGGLAYNYLDTYIEPGGATYGRTPRLILQDGMNVNTGGTIPNDITASTEARDVAGCNGCMSGSSCGDSWACYYSDPYWYNGRGWDGNTGFQLNAWHLVEAYFKMNSISGSKAVADGVMWLKVDGNYVINHSNVVYRTNTNSTMTWREVVIAPWIGDGSPQAQTMWMDELEVADSPPDVAATPCTFSGAMITGGSMR